MDDDDNDEHYYAALYRRKFPHKDKLDEIKKEDHKVGPVQANPEWPFQGHVSGKTPC